MTKFDFNDKISIIILENSSFNIKIYVEGNAVKKSFFDKPHCKCTNTCCNIETMDNLNLNLAQLTNCFVQLFYKTNQRYTCTRTKIGKLLSILAFKYAREGKLAFKEIIHKYEDCGTAIYEIISRFDDREVYSKCKYDDKIAVIPDEYIDSNAFIPDEFLEISDIDNDVLMRVQEVFKQFGSYSPTELGECINPIVNHPNIVNNNGEIILENLQSLTYNELVFGNNVDDLTLAQYLLK